MTNQRILEEIIRPLIKNIIGAIDIERNVLCCTADNLLTLVHSRLLDRLTTAKAAHELAENDLKTALNALITIMTEEEGNRAD